MVPVFSEPIKNEAAHFTHCLYVCYTQASESQNKNTVNRENPIENSAEINISFEYHDRGWLSMLSGGIGYFAENDTIYENPPKEGFIIRDYVEIMSEADTFSDVLGLLKLHDRIEILAEARILQLDEMGNWSKNWYKIIFNDIEGYIRTCCADKQKHLFNINGNNITVYPRRANGMFDDRRHNPYFMYHRFQSRNIFINNRHIQLPDSIIRGDLKGGEVIDGNLHLIYGHFFDEHDDSRIIISTEGEKIYIGTEDIKQYLQNGKKGGTYTQNKNHIWVYKP
jgi:hypothetical protein